MLNKGTVYVKIITYTVPLFAYMPDRLLQGQYKIWRVLWLKSMCMADLLRLMQW